MNDAADDGGDTICVVTLTVANIMPVVCLSFVKSYKVLQSDSMIASFPLIL